MKWSNLKIRRCPKCDGLLRSEGANLLKCNKEGCGFVIGEAKRAEILLNIESKVGVTGKRKFEEGYGE